MAWRNLGQVRGWFATPNLERTELGFTMREIPRWSTWSAGLVVVAGILHLVVLPMHLAEARGNGFYFFTIGAAQVVWGFLFLLNPTPVLRRLGLVFLTVAPVVLWILTRTVRSPWGTAAEPMDFTSFATLALEMGAAVALVFSHIADAHATGTPLRNLRILVAVGVIVGAVTYIGAIGAEATLPWLGEPEVMHHGAEAEHPVAQDSGTMPADHGHSEEPMPAGGHPSQQQL